MMINKTRSSEPIASSRRSSRKEIPLSWWKKMESPLPLGWPSQSQLKPAISVISGKTNIT